MDGYVAQQAVAAFNGDEGQQFDEQTEQEIYSDGYGLETIRNVDGSSGNEMRHSIDGNPHRDSSAGKLFVGGIAWETSSETFTSYFSKYGEILDSIIMMDKITGRPRGFGFVTFADPSVADKVLEEEHVIDGRTVEVKRTVPRDDMRPKGVLRTRKIFVGGLPISLTEDEFREYFSSYGNILEHQIMVDHDTGRSRGFGFVTFEAEEAVDVILSDGQMHELGGKQVEIKRAEPKRVGADDRQWRHGGGSGRQYGVFGGGAAAYGGGYGGKMGRGYGGFGGYNSAGYANFGNYGGDSSGFFAGYGGYGYGFGFGGAAMYGGAGYGAGGYGAPAGYGGGGVYGGSGGGVYGSSKGFGGGGGYGSGKGYSGSGGVGGGRHHPYRK